MNLPNHQRVFKGLLLHEHLLTRDFQGDQHFFRKDGSIASYPTMPGSVSASNAGEPVTQIVPHEDAPAFSDIATTATAAATSPLTTFSPTTPGSPMSLPQRKSSKERTRGADKVEPTTDTLTTQVTPNNRGSGSENKPVASLSSRESQPQSWSAFPIGSTVAPSSVWIEKGEARETAVKNKSSSDHLLPKSQEERTITTSTAVITTTTITALQTSGTHVSYSFSNVRIRLFKWHCTKWHQFCINLSPVEIKKIESSYWNLTAASQRTGKLGIRSSASLLFISHSAHSYSSLHQGWHSCSCVKNNLIFPDVSCPSFPLATEGWKPWWVVSDRISAEIVRGLWGQGDTGGLSERSVVREKGNHLSFRCLPQSPAVWISLTLRVASKSYSKLTLEWSATTWLRSTSDMALRFRSVLQCFLIKCLNLKPALICHLWGSCNGL